MARKHLRNHADVRTLGFIGLYYALLLSEWLFVPLEARFVVPLVIATASLSWLCAVIAHNALHCPLFERSWENSVFQLMLTCAYGFAVSEYIPGHNLSHHMHTQGPADVIRTSKTPFVRFNFLNLFYFFPRVGADVVVQNYRFVAASKGRLVRWRNQLLVEVIACWATKIALLIVDWRRALIFVVLPHLWALYGITTVNFLQHDGCDETHPVNHSRNFVGRIFNWFTFNNGFHGAHHDQPGLHWSLLAEAHRERFRGAIAPELEQPSLFVYMVKTFVFPGRRQRYDGRRILAVRAEPDEEWIPVRLQMGDDQAPRAG
ncbi:MAG: fatty acid desaturase [Polyangiaceae bacterium]|jgi:fatty acid desaturase